MKNQFNAMLLTAALAGLAGGSAVAAHAATQSTPQANQVKAARPAFATPASTRTPPNTPVKAKTTVKARAAASPATTVARARTAARARADAPPTAPNAGPRLTNRSSSSSVRSSQPGRCRFRIVTLWTQNCELGTRDFLLKSVQGSPFTVFKYEPPNTVLLIP